MYVYLNVRVFETLNLLKAGEIMPLEAIKLVTESEKQSKEKIAQAELKAKSIISDAENQGAKLLEESIKKADTQCKAFMAKAEEQGAKISNDVVEETKEQQQQLKQLALSRMEEAANLIVGRIVND